MKKQLQFTGTFVIDFDAERERIEKCFSNKGYLKVKKRQMELIDLFEKGDFQGWCDAYNKLPYFEKNEHPEQEFVSPAFTDVIHVLGGWEKFEVSEVKYVNDNKEVK